MTGPAWVFVGAAIVSFLVMVGAMIADELTRRQDRERHREREAR